MWSKILAFNSFVLLPAAVIFLIYAAGNAVFFWHWKQFLIAVILLLAVLAAELVIAILAD